MSHDHAPHAFAPNECLRCGHELREHGIDVDLLARALHFEFYDDSVPREANEACCRSSAERIAAYWNQEKRWRA